MNDLPVGRSVDETLRLVQAFQYTDVHGEVCPAGWKPGQDTVNSNIFNLKPHTFIYFVRIMKVSHKITLHCMYFGYFISTCHKNSSHLIVLPSLLFHIIPATTEAFFCIVE